MSEQRNCDVCVNFCYDEFYDCYTCCMDLDEDEMAQFLKGSFSQCPYFRFGDEYTIVKKQAGQF